MKICINKDQVNLLLAAVFHAGRVILDIRQQGVEQTLKNDNSPVTEADQQAEIIILQALSEQFAQIPVIAEEEAAAGRLPAIGDTFFLVDALDGTKEFIKGGENFTINIGLIQQQVPIFGIIYAPVTGKLFVGGIDVEPWQGQADCQQENPIISEKKSLKVTNGRENSAKALASYSHGDQQTTAWLKDHNINQLSAVSSSIKFCLIAAGIADVYPRFGPTMEWDTAAGHAILSAAGGRVTGLSGEPFLYAKSQQAKPFLNPGFIAWGGFQK